RVLEYLLLAASQAGFRIPPPELCRELRLAGEVRDQLTTSALHRFDLAVDVPVVHTDRRETDSCAGSPARDHGRGGRGNCDPRQGGGGRGTGRYPGGGDEQVPAGDLF